MANLYWSDKKLLGELLRDYTEIPDFQRNYSWDVPLVDIFWNDVVSFSDRYPGATLEEQEYFIGPVVLVAQAGQPKKILDGQQRLATSTILLSVARHYLQELGTTAAAARIQENYIAGYDDYRRTHAYHLTLNQYDRDFFRREIQEPRDVTGYVEPDPSLESHRLIRAARQYFMEQFGRKRTELGANTQAFSEWIIRINKVVTDHLSVVHVTSDNEDNAALVFETLNDRGIGLSAPDLLRNLLLARADEAQRAEVIDSWREVLGIEGKASVEDFLRHFWLSREGDVKTRSLYREIKNKILADNIDSAELSRELQAESETYENIANATDEDADLKDSLEAVIALGARSAFPLILSAYSVGNLEQKRSLLKMIVSVYVRHSTIGGLENSKIESLLFALAKNLRENSDFTIVMERLRAFAPPDADFQDRFRTARSTKSGSTKYVLRKIEMHMRQGTGETALAAAAKLNLEHIYPVNPIATRLPRHDEVVNRIGNLTLLTRRMNRDLKNAPFPDKKTAYEASELRITNELAQHNDWGVDEIDARQERLAGLVSEIWPIDQ